MKVFHLVIAGLAFAAVSLQAQTYYFTPTGPTTATNRNTYSDPVGWRPMDALAPR